MANNSIYQFERPTNEPGRGFMPGSPEKTALKDELARQQAGVERIPLIIGGKPVYTEKTVPVVLPHDHHHVIAELSIAGPEELAAAIKAAMDAKEAWEALSTEHRLAIFEKAAALVAGPWRNRIVASNMLGQSKVVRQAEGESACALADFLRFGVADARRIYADQPMRPGFTEMNRVVYRPLEGFVVAVAPFNFTSISCNLACAPALCGNVVLWKPSTTAALASWRFMQVLMEAGLPAGVINFIPCRGDALQNCVLASPDFAGFHFTGSTQVFSDVWRFVGEHIDAYKTYPRLVGETGGKDFVFAHPSADIDALVACLALSPFEYQGQKCSAASRAYVPKSIWPKVREKLLAAVATLKVGDPCDFRNMLGAVIDERAYRRCADAIDAARDAEDATLLCGGHDDDRGWFIYPAVIETGNPHYDTMERELFGPVLTVYPYDDDKLDETLALCDASEYGLTGSIYCEGREELARLEWVLRNAAGNLYLNDKPSGSAVGQQPFGGARRSGTNDKAGTALNLHRWMSPCAVKEAYAPSPAITYPHMTEE